MSLLDQLSALASGTLELAGAGRGKNSLALAQLHKGIEDEKSFSRLDNAINVTAEFDEIIIGNYRKSVEAAEASGNWDNVDSAKMDRYKEAKRVKGGILSPSIVREMLGKEKAIEFANRTFLPEFLGPGKFGSAATVKEVETDLGSALDVKVTTVNPENGEMYDEAITDGGVLVDDGGSPIPPLTDEVMDTAFWTTIDKNYDKAVMEAYARVPGSSATLKRIGLQDMGSLTPDQYPEVRAAKQKVLEDNIEKLGGPTADALQAWKDEQAKEKAAFNQQSLISSSGPSQQTAQAQQVQQGGPSQITGGPPTGGPPTGGPPTGGPPDNQDASDLAPGTGVKKDPNDPRSPLLFGEDLEKALFGGPWTNQGRARKRAADQQAYLEAGGIGVLDPTNVPTFSDLSIKPLNLTDAQYRSLSKKGREDAVKLRREDNKRLRDGLWGAKAEGGGASPAMTYNTEVKKYAGSGLSSNDRFGQSVGEFDKTVDGVETFYKIMRTGTSNGTKNKEKFLTYLQQNPDELKAWQDSPFEFAMKHMNNTNTILGDPPSSEVKTIIDKATTDLKDNAPELNAKTIIDEIRNSQVGYVPSETVNKLKEAADKLVALKADAENELVEFLEAGGDMRRMGDTDMLALLAAISSTFPKDDARSQSMFNAFAQQVPLYAETSKWSMKGVEHELKEEEYELKEKEHGTRVGNLDARLAELEFRKNEFTYKKDQDAIKHNQWQQDHILKQKDQYMQESTWINSMTTLGQQTVTDLDATSYWTDVINMGDPDINFNDKLTMSKPFFSVVNEGMKRLARKDPKRWNPQEKNDYLIFSSRQKLGFENLLVNYFNDNKSKWAAVVEMLPWVDKTSVHPGVMSEKGATNLIAIDINGQPTMDKSKIAKYYPYNSRTGAIDTAYSIPRNAAEALYGPINGLNFIDDSAVLNAKYKIAIGK